MTDTPVPTHTPYKAKNLTIHLWATGAIADYMMYAMFALIPGFFVTSFGMNPIWVSWALFLPRIFDGIADPIIGHFSDNLHSPWGRRRPFIFVSGIIGSGLIVGLWWMSTEWSPYVQFSFLLIMSLLLFLCWGTYNMNHLALGYELSDDYHQRTKVIAVRAFYFSCAALSGSYFYWVAGLKYFNGEVNGMRFEAVVIAAVALIATHFTVFFSKERFQKANRNHVNILEAIKATLQVKPFVILLGLRVIQTLGTSLYGATAFYIGVYSVCQNDKHLYNSLPIYNGWIGLGMAFLMVPLSSVLSRGIGKRRGLIASYGFGFLSACLLPFFAQPGMPYLLLTHMIVFNVLFGVMLGMFQGAVMPDICDIDELKSGERREGLFSAVNSFVSKMENSVCALLGGYILAFSGFDAEKAKKTAALAADATQAARDALQQTPDVLEKLRWLGFTPAIVFSGLAFLIVWLYPVTEKYMANVRAQLDERRRKGLAQEGVAGAS